jgi:hypothetical protein
MQLTLPLSAETKRGCWNCRNFTPSGNRPAEHEPGLWYRGSCALRPGGIADHLMRRDGGNDLPVCAIDRWEAQR